MLKLVDESELSERGTKGRKGTGASYSKYAVAIRPQIEFFKEKIKLDPRGSIRVRIDDIKKTMGSTFVSRNDTTIYWGLKHALFFEGIVIFKTKHQDGSGIFELRERTEKDELPASLAKKKSIKVIGTDNNTDNINDTETDDEDLEEVEKEEEV